MHAVAVAYMAFLIFLIFGRPRQAPARAEESQGGPPPEGAPPAPAEVTSHRAGYLFALWCLLSMGSKLLLEHDWMTSSMKMDPRDWIWTVATGLTGISVVALVAGRFFVPVLWFCNVVLCAVFWIDILYLRYFDDIPGIYLLNGIGQGAAVAPSAWRLREANDLWLFADLLLPLLWMVFASRQFKRGASIPRAFAAQLLVALTVYHGISYSRLDSDELRLFRLRFRNMAIVEEVGLLNYHAYDILQQVQSRWVNLVDRTYDKQLMADIINRSRTSMNQDTPYKGMFKGRNLLVIQLESLERFVLDVKIDGQEVMPYFNQLKKKCLWGPLQDQTGQGRSSDGEFIYNNSLLPPGERPLVYAYPNNHYFGIPAVLNEKNYYTLYAVPYWGSFWNCRFMSEQYGFRHHMLRDDFRAAEDGETLGWGLTDKALLLRIVPRLLTLPQPFYCYAVTLMSHHPYEEVDDKDQPLKFPESLDGTLVKEYLKCCKVRDEQLKDVVTYLQSSGLWDNTVVVFVGDHDARVPDKEMALLQNTQFDHIDKLLHDQVMLAIHCPGDWPAGPLPKDAVQVDLVPTLVALMGAQDVPSCFFGRNMLAKRDLKSRISKGGYALDSKFAVTDEDVDFTAYRLEDHKLLPATEKVALREETQRWFKFVYDFLRLDLVPTVRSEKQ